MPSGQDEDSTESSSDKPCWLLSAGPGNSDPLRVVEFEPREFGHSLLFRQSHSPDSANPALLAPQSLYTARYSSSVSLDVRCFWVPFT